MIIYILYNADLLKIPRGKNEDAIRYMDDTMLVATGATFEETVLQLKAMMERENGGFKWSKDYNSCFEISKVTVMHMSWKLRDGEGGEKIKLRTEAPPLTVEGKVVEAVEHYKYLGVQVDAELRWNTQEMHAVERAMKWVLLYKQLTKPSTGVRMQLMKQMYMAVGVPKMMYALDV
jgi:hypothetical protein